MLRHQVCGVMWMGINERIAQMKERIQRIKEKRNIITKLQVFKFKPISYDPQIGRAS